MQIGATPLFGLTSEYSVDTSYPPFTNHPSYGPLESAPKKYEFVFSDGNMAVSRGMMTRLCQEGHIFKMLLFGGNGFRKELPGVSIQTLEYYGITKESFQALVLSLRTNNPSLAYKYKLLYESIGGFKTIDKYHMERMKERMKKKKKNKPDEEKENKRPHRSTINLISDDEGIDFD